MEMSVRFLLLLQLQTILSWQHIAAHPLPLEEDPVHIASHLRLTAKRLASMLQNVADPSYASELEQLHARYKIAAEATDVKREAQPLDSYEDQLAADFHNYVHDRLDEQFLNEDIRIQEWSLRQLMTHVDADLVNDIAVLLPDYERAVTIKDVDEKYNFYADIQEHFTPALQALIDKYPEDIALLKVQLQFEHEFLLYLQAQQSEYAAEIKDTLNVLELAVESNSIEEMLSVLDRFDDVDTAFGRYLGEQVWEFEFHRFGG